MDCDRAREAISARIDGEDTGVPDGALEAHLTDCGACRDWQLRAHVMTRRARLGGPFLDHDLADRVLAAVPPAPSRRRLRMTLRVALAAVAAGQLAITVPLLVLGHDPEAGTHAAHELGSFNLALAIAFAIGAIRPALSAGLAWPSGMAAAGLVGTALADLIGGQTVGADEAQHLIAAAGALLLLWQARVTGGGAADAGTAEVTSPPSADRRTSAAMQDTASRRDYPLQSPGGDAARLRGPGAAFAARPAAWPAAAARVETGQEPDDPRLRRNGNGTEAVA